ncbi:protein phosphatase regulatory subunit Reg1 [Schizosaccharomyces octosporus yFS286]|uniref:Protein phosphatase regulatory subunit Reg1 n=1 Tax=Schizosaccharomyces octosporus (strain yFS286) TaxID=483514 RepID=S9RA45_SCHOY|nr:protein phosphatase regulatory subunit Reg1 [Schizosaccharomyces octosporus yFS286]EPX75000.1 protein phosphatase regulatory subunit Reg1 [Schizosaccharomyces octosporus yFS286]
MAVKPDVTIGRFSDEEFAKSNHSHFNSLPSHQSHPPTIMLETHGPTSLSPSSPTSSSPSPSPSSSSAAYRKPQRKARSQSLVSSPSSPFNEKTQVHPPGHIQDLSVVLNTSNHAVPQLSVAPPPPETDPNLHQDSFIAYPRDSSHAMATKQDQSIFSSSSRKKLHPFVNSDSRSDAPASHSALLSDEIEYEDVLNEASPSNEPRHPSFPIQHHLPHARQEQQQQQQQQPKPHHHHLHHHHPQESNPSLPITFDHKTQPDIDNDQIFLSSSCPTQHGFPSHPQDSFKDIQPNSDLASLPRIQLMLLGADDSEIKKNALTQVDYLSHEWSETDIWASWREITKSKNSYENGLRLENASWRSWIKYKYHLPTISPETLNWLKECDVTWLYGPLLHASMPSIHNSQILKQQQTHADGSNQNQDGNEQHDSGSERSSQTSINKKPILKRRSPQEVLLSGRDVTPRPQASRLDTLLRYPSNEAASNSNVHGLRGPVFRPSHSAQPSRRIHFNDKVQQCIAVDFVQSSKNSSATDLDDYAGSEETKKSDEDSNEVFLDGPRASQPNNSRSIAELPDSTLKVSIEDQIYNQENKDHFGRDGRSRFPRIPEYYGENDFEEDEIYREDRHYGGFEDYDHNILVDGEGDGYYSDDDAFAVEDISNYRGEQSDDSSNDESQFLEYANDRNGSDEDELSESPPDHDSMPSSPYSVFSRTPSDAGSMGNRSIYSPYLHSPNESNVSRSVDERTGDEHYIDMNDMVSNNNKSTRKLTEPKTGSSSSVSFSKQISPATPTIAENLQTVSLGPSSMESEVKGINLVDGANSPKVRSTQVDNTQVRSTDQPTNRSKEQQKGSSLNTDPSNRLVGMLQNKLKSWNE